MSHPNPVAHRAPAGRSLATALFLGSLLLLAFVVPSRAAQAAGVQRHDLSHPIHLLATTTRDTASQIEHPVLAWLGPVLIVSAPRSAVRALAIPWETTPAPICLNGVAYAQGERVNGQMRWWIGGTYTQLTAYVVYFWCASPSNPAGYNFAYTVEWFNHTYDARWPQSFTLGQRYSPAYHTTLSLGATLERSDGRISGDGEVMHTFIVAVNQVVADYSVPQDGRSHYKGVLHVSALDVSAVPPTGVPLDFQVADPYVV